MSASGLELLRSGVCTPSDDGALRIARYSVFPRAASEHSVRSGLMLDGRSASLRLVTTAPQQAGELLRISVQNLTGRTHDTLARVVSCERYGDEGRFELALEALDTRRPRFVRSPTNG